MPESQSDKALNENHWPQDVSVREWFNNKPNERYAHRAKDNVYRSKPRSNFIVTNNYRREDDNRNHENDE